MDREKLNKAAEEAAYDYDKSFDDYLNGFVRGADWLMQQSISERLTDEEKKKIKDDYNSLANKLQKKFNLSHKEKVITNTAIGSVLTYIFGVDLFKEK